MSTELDQTDLPSPGFPELTELGKRLEVLRIERGLSKQHLARVAGTSRQQLWRVMTGKSELSVALRQRLADVLRVDTTTLADTVHATFQPVVELTDGRAVAAQTAANAPGELFAYLTDHSHVERTLRSLPNDAAGRDVKRALLNALEDQALARRIPLGAHFFEVRRPVLSGEL